jgi:hypothetical protein
VNPIRTARGLPANGGPGQTDPHTDTLVGVTPPGLYHFEQPSPRSLGRFSNDFIGTSNVLCTARVPAIARTFDKEGHRHYELSDMQQSAHPSLPAPRNSRISSSRSPVRAPIPLFDMRSPLFPLVSFCQSQRTVARICAPSIALAMLSEPELGF